jgi:hypothetical protein
VVSRISGIQPLGSATTLQMYTCRLNKYCNTGNTVSYKLNIQHGPPNFTHTNKAFLQNTDFGRQFKSSEYMVYELVISTVQNLCWKVSALAPKSPAPLTKQHTLTAI